MEFKDLFNPLKKCLGDGYNRQEFFRDMMAMITTVTEDEWGTELDPNTRRTNNNTIFNYIKRGLSQTFAQAIVNRLTPEVLEERINEKPQATREALACELSVYDESINVDNVGKRASEMMVDIIIKSAGLHSAEEIKAAKEAESLKKAVVKQDVIYDLSEAEEIKAREFLINHEEEKNLIPLCQVALLYSSTHKHIRPMYNEFLLLPGRVQQYILKNCGAEEAGKIDSLHFDEALDLFCKDLEEYGLSSKRYLYMFNQYLYCAFRYYSNREIDSYDTYSFIRLNKSVYLSFEGASVSSLDNYIDDYLWMKDNDNSSKVCPPMDYLVEEKNLRSCDEDELTFWLCRFVIDVCANLYHRIAPDDVDLFYINDQYAKTQEDLYYCALLALYNLFCCHELIC